MTAYRSTHVCLVRVKIHGVGGYWAPALFVPKGARNERGQVCQWDSAEQMGQYQASNSEQIARVRAIEAAEKMGLRFLDHVL